MTDTLLERTLRRDRLILLAALAALAALAWAAVIGLGSAMPMPSGGGVPAGADMAGHGGAVSGTAGRGVLAPALMPWSAADFLLMALMWVAMMIGMMTPSAAPMILLYARVGRQALAGGTPFAPAGWFASGYFIAWTAAALLATWLQWGLERALLLTPEMAAATPRFAGLLLVAAGVYQWTPLKSSCLAHCRSPLQFIQRHGGFRPDRAGALGLGLRHGLYCIGCCWALMLLLFVGGVMNLLWIATIAALVLAEKLSRFGRMVSRLTGLVLAAWGIAALAGLA